MNDSLTVLILAAGKGTRMKSGRPKVLHPLAGRPMIGHVLAAAAALRPERAVVVLATGMAEVEAVLAKAPLPTATVIQDPPLGTGHAVVAAIDALPAAGDLLVLYGDTPLVTAATLERLVAARREAGAAVAVLGMRPPDPSGYGRLAFDGEQLAALVEERHADARLRREGLCNSGVMALDLARLRPLLDALELRREKGEYYLTDIVLHARARGWACVAIEGPWRDGIGINSRLQLAEAEAVVQDRLRRAALERGVHLVAPVTVHLSADTELAADVEVGPYVVFGPGVTVAEGTVILPFSHLEGVAVGPGARVGPFAWLRPGVEIGSSAPIGTAHGLGSSL